MTVKYYRSTRQPNGEYQQEEYDLDVESVLEMRSMPDGCYSVETMDKKGDDPAFIISLNPVLFIAICVFRQLSSKPTVCYGVQTSTEGGIIWHHNDYLTIYAYGPYKQSCELVGEKALPFLEWYKKRTQGIFDFDIAIQS